MAELFARKKVNSSAPVTRKKDASEPSQKKPQLRVQRSVYSKVLIMRALKALAWAVGIGFLIYLCFALTIMRFVPTLELGPILVRNVTAPGGITPAGDNLLVNVERSEGTEIIDYLRQAFIPTADAALVRVEAPPYSKLSWAEPGLVTVNGVLVDASMPTPPENEVIANEYLVTCISGACTPGEAFVLPTNHILGDPLLSKGSED